MVRLVHIQLSKCVLQNDVNHINGRENIILKLEGKMERWFISLVGNDEYMYWITEICCHIMRMDVSTNTVEYLRPHINTSIGGFVGSAALCMKDNMIYFVVKNGEFLMSYNTTTNHARVVRIDRAESLINMYCFSKVIGDELVVVPIYYPKIIYINVNTGVVSEIDILECGDKREGLVQYFSLNCRNDGDDITFISPCERKMIIYSMVQRKVLYKEKLPDEMGEVVDFVNYGDGIIGLNSKNKVIYWNHKECRVLFQTENEETGRYGALHLSNGKLWVFPFYANDIYTISLPDMSFEKYEKFPNDYKYTAPEGMGKFFKKITGKDKTYFAMHSGNYLLSVNNLTGNMEVETLSWPDSDSDLDELNYQGRVLSERLIPMSTYLKYILQR